MSDAIGFNFIPGVGVVAPLFAFEVNSGGLFEPVNRFIVIGHGGTGAASATNTPQPISSLQQADYLFGQFSMVREMARVALLNAPALPLWGISVPFTGTQAVWTDTIAAWTGTGVAAMEIEGEPIQVSVGASDTPTTIGAAIAAAVNGYWNPLTGKKLALSATASAGVVTYTARNPGVVYNSIDFYVPINVTGNVLTQAGVLTHVAATAGAGTPNLATALANLGDSPADCIVTPWSDATNLANYAATTNDTSGRWAWSRQSYGHVWTIDDDTISNQTTLGASLNDRHLTVLGVASLPTPDWTTIAATAASVAEWLFDVVTGNVSRSHAGIVVQGVRAPRLASNWPGWTQRNTMLQTGISTWRANAAKQFCIDKLISTSQFGPQGQPDVTFRDVQKLYQAAGGISFIRAQLANEQGNKAIADVNPGNLLAVTTTKQIAATIANAYAQLNRQGVFDDPATFVQNLVVARDATNPDRVNVYAPIVTVDPLDVIAANATFYASAAQLPSS